MSNLNTYSKRLSLELRGKIVGMIDRVALKTFKSVRRWIVTSWWDDEGDVDDNVEVFQGIGYVARPPEGTNAEAVLVNIGGFDHPCLVALRDAATTAAVVKAVGLDPDEGITHNSKSLLKFNADGTVEIRGVNGTAVPLATKADVQALWDYLAQQFDPTTGHKHTAPGPITTTAVQPSTAPSSIPVGEPSGTTIFKAQ